MVTRWLITRRFRFNSYLRNVYGTNQQKRVGYNIVTLSNIRVCSLNLVRQPGKQCLEGGGALVGKMAAYGPNPVNGRRICMFLEATANRYEINYRHSTNGATIFGAVNLITEQRCLAKYTGSSTGKMHYIGATKLIGKHYRTTLDIQHTAPPSSTHLLTYLLTGLRTRACRE
jgi:hypothetical protein